MKKILVGLATAAGMALIVIAGIEITHSISSSMRLTRIDQIYSHLDLGNDYIAQKTDIFGNKREYEWDDSRSYSSSIVYTVGKTVDTAVAETRKAIENEGFSYFEDAYPGGGVTELHFKSGKGEYIHLIVSSKLRADAFFNASIMKLDTTSAANIDTNAGPATVTIKVNLDDNK